MQKPLPDSLADPRRLGAIYADKAAYVAAARRILNCQALAEDVVQDVMLRLVAEPPSPSGTHEPYVARMVRNLAIDRARRMRFELRTFSDLDDAVTATSSDGSDPERSAAASQSLRLAQAAMASLPEPIRTVFRLHRVEGVPQNEIAARMGVSRAQVCGLVRRGHVRCLAALDGTPGVPACRARVCPLGGDAQDGGDRHGAEAIGQERRRDPARQRTLEALETR